MNQPPTVFRERTFYNSDPDYTRPLFQIRNGCRARMHARLCFLYGEDQAKTWLPELERIIQVHIAEQRGAVADAFQLGPGLAAQ